MAVKRIDKTKKSPALWIVESFFNSISQVLLIENPLTGLLVLAGLFVSSIQAGLATVLAVVTALLFATAIGASKEKIGAGLYGFSPVLVGVAVVLFFEGWEKWIIIVVASVITVLLTIWLNWLLGHWGLPSLTFPFIVTVWLLLLASYSMTKISSEISFLPLLEPFPVTEGTGDIPALLVKGFGEVFLQDSIIGSILILAGIVLSGRRNAIMAVSAVVISIVAAVSVGMDRISLEMGLYTYSTILTMLALGSTFYEKGKFTMVFAVMGGFLTVWLTPVVSILVHPFGLTALTMPFVLVTWIFLGIQQAMGKKEY